MGTYEDHPFQQLMAIRIQHPELVPSNPSEIFLGEKCIGTMTSFAWAPNGMKGSGLARIQKEHAIHDLDIVVQWGKKQIPGRLETTN